MKNVLSKYRNHAFDILILLILLLGFYARFYFYGDPNLSIAGNDTQSFVDSSRVPLFSKEIFTGQRLLTTNLIYKIFEPKEGYEITVNGSVETTRRKFQNGFNNLVIAQTIISIIGWGFLAYVIAQQLKNRTLKILCIILIIFFAFTPQIADWDSILMSESLNFSLFALQLGFLIKLSFLFYQSPQEKHTGWLVGWFITYFLWSFVRPTNLLVALVTIGMLAILLLFSKRYRSNWQIWKSILFVFLVFILSVVTTGNSKRSLNYNVYQSDILPNPNRVAIFQNWGMPNPNSPEYQTWFKEHSAQALMKFMITHPGYPFEKLWRDFPEAFKANRQTYFKAPELDPAREVLTQIGTFVHPLSHSIFLINLLSLIGIMYSAYLRNNEIKPWAWIGLWLFLTASGLILIAILGDSWGLIRHALHGTTIYRFCLWLFILILLDIVLSKSAQTPELVKNPTL